MSEHSHDTSRLSADDRYDLALSGNAASRRNKPSHLVIIAGMVFVIACSVLGLTSCQSSKVRDNLKGRVSQRDTVAKLLAELTAIERAADPEAEAVFEPYPGFRSKMEEIADQTGLSNKLEFARRNQSQDAPGAVRVTFDYNDIEEDSLGPLLAFAQAATDQIPGTYVAGITLRPRPDKWQMDIKFERWERIGQP